LAVGWSIWVAVGGVIIAQPDWKNTDDFKKLRAAEGIFGVTAGISTASYRGDG